ncbi:trafficking protein particle complex subunit 11 [Anopheles maculipalpis]|uniref:trafficking protein particle complex subunit 11 n=1 Tax=Anopheles maculipalpis TaxID=1496333 RepID=UPI002158C137|nr:trafficking protein particle complex subunit 11 [Anopheles maculipalpis]
MSLDASVLPSELLTTAAPLVGLSGLDVQRNAIHKTIWDAFNNAKKPDTESIQYKLLPPNYEFPVSKPKHQSYEWYTPKGILKRNWMLKHLHVLPAVVVLFQDLEWNDPKWTEKQLQCAATIQVLKNSLQGRNTRIAIALLQRGHYLQQGEDMLASERAAQLTSNCDINAKMLFVLPHNDHLMGHIFRLQSAFLELAQSYYTQLMKQIRLHRDQLTDAHTVLKIRHQFKLGFLSELKHDQSNALRHYRQTYTFLDDVRIVDTNCLELKTIAGFVNYKMCKLFFRLNAPKDSISQFKNHIHKYRPRTGFKELLFEHYAWLSVQYSAFAELFCDAVKNGLAPLQTQHPGIYFHKAAEYIGMRKEAFLQCTALDTTGPAELGSISNSALYSDFFGIRGSVKTGEPVSEQQIICLVQENEKAYNHSGEIIALLGKAMAQFKVYRCLRFRKKLAIDMAEEYLKSGDHSKALTLYSLMLTDYRVDKWYTIFTQVLLKTLHSAYLSASVPDFVACSIEALSPRIAMEKQERILILENLWKVFHRVSPVSSSLIAPELSSSWQSALTSFNTPIKLDLDRLNDLVECRLTFEKRQIKNDEKLQLLLYIRSLTEVPLKLKNFSILLTDLKSSSVRINAVQYAEYAGPADDNIAVDSSSKPIEEFILEPEKCYRILFVGDRCLFAESVDVHIFRLELQMGSEKTHAVLSVREKLNTSKAFKSYNPHKDCMESIGVISSCYIIPTFHLGSQTKPTNQPMLTNEFHQVTTKIFNQSDLCLQNVGVSISVPQLLRNNVFLTTDLNHPLQKIHSHVQIDIGELQMQSSTTVSYYLASLVAGNIELKQRMYYQMENLHQSKVVDALGGTTLSGNNGAADSPSTPNSEKEDLAKLLANEKSLQQYVNNHNVKIEFVHDDGQMVRKIKEDTVVVPCVEEIKLTGRFYTLSREALVRAYRNEDFLLRVNMEIKSPDPIDILETQFISDHNIVEKQYQGGKPIGGSGLRPATRFEDLKLLSASNCTRDWVSRGNFLSKDTQLVFNRSRSPDGAATALPANRPIEEQQYNKNLLSKLPTNATIIGSTSAQLTNQMNLSLTHHPSHAALADTTTDGDGISQSSAKGVNASMTTSTGSVEDFKVKPLPLNDSSALSSSNASKAGHLTGGGDDLVGKNVTKTIFNRTLDCVQLTNNDRNGFINAHYNKPEPGTNVSSTVAPNGTGWPVFGVYCVRWCRSRTPNVVNESKFIINGIEVIDPPLNLYCYIEQRMYVRLPMTLRVTLRNPTRRILHLQAILNSSDSFMFAGHRQLNVSIFAYSTYDLLFNLCPLKAGWQPLPELQLEYQNFQPTATPNPAPGIPGTQPVAVKFPTDSVPATIPTGEADVIAEGVESQRRAELASLVQRWMPKMVFVHPPTRTL